SSRCRAPRRTARCRSSSTCTAAQPERGRGRCSRTRCSWPRRGTRFCCRIRAAASAAGRSSPARTSATWAAVTFGTSLRASKRSPVYHAHKCKTPTLILHGEDDLCTRLPQAREFYNALVEAGCETELVVYPREGHGWLERDHQIDTWNRMRDWLAQHLG